MPSYSTFLRHATLAVRRNHHRSLAPEAGQESCKYTWTAIACQHGGTDGADDKTTASAVTAARTEMERLREAHTGCRQKTSVALVS